MVKVYTQDEVDDIIKAADTRLAAIVLKNDDLWKQIQTLQEKFNEGWDKIQQDVVDLKDSIEKLKPKKGDVTSPYAR